MKVRSSKKITSLLLCMMLIVAMAFTTVGCSDNKQEVGENQNDTETTAQMQSFQEQTDNVLGEGQMKFLFIVVDKDGNETNFEIYTDKETVGEALLELELISGDKGEYGLYVKTVNGITADYEVDQTYWAFYVNDEYSLTGVDTTLIEEEVIYSFKVEK